MKDWKRHLQVASGYLDLGMVNEAADEIEEIDPPDKTRLEVLAFRVEIFRLAEKWEAVTEGPEAGIRQRGSFSGGR